VYIFPKEDDALSLLNKRNERESGAFNCPSLPCKLLVSQFVSHEGGSTWTFLARKLAPLLNRVPPIDKGGHQQFVLDCLTQLWKDGKVVAIDEIQRDASAAGVLIQVFRLFSCFCNFLRVLYRFVF
jgi:hypothetical protein